MQENKQYEVTSKILLNILEIKKQKEWPGTSF